MHIKEKLSEVHTALLSHSNSIQLFVANEYMNHLVSNHIFCLVFLS